MTLADGAAEGGRPLTALSVGFFSPFVSPKSPKVKTSYLPLLLPAAKMAFCFFLLFFFFAYFFSPPAHSAQISSGPRIANTSTVRAQTLRGVRRRRTRRSERKDGRTGGKRESGGEEDVRPIGEQQHFLIRQCVMDSRKSKATLLPGKLRNRDLFRIRLQRRSKIQPDRSLQNHLKSCWQAVSSHQRLLVSTSFASAFALCSGRRAKWKDEDRRRASICKYCQTHLHFKTLKRETAQKKSERGIEF